MSVCDGYLPPSEDNHLRFYGMRDINEREETATTESEEPCLVTEVWRNLFGEEAPWM